MAVFFYDQNNINTDLMFPGKYTYESSDIEFIKEHLFEDLDVEFSKIAKPGDIIFVGKNFGCGSSREQPSVGLKALGIKAIVAKSFSRIFYRSATNQGLLLIESPEAVEYYSNGDKVEVEVDEKKGLIKVGDKEFSFPPLPQQMQDIINEGGLLSQIKNKIVDE